MLPENLQAIPGFRLIEAHLLALRQHYDHGNRRLHMNELVTAYLLSFFNPALRSLRMIEALEADERFVRSFESASLRKSTFSDAARLFDPHLLLPLVRELRHQVPHLRRSDENLNGIVQRLIAMDGSIFTIASDVAWAIHQRKSNARPGAKVRLDLSLSIETGLVQSFVVSGKGDGGESAAMISQIVPEKIYIMDRGYVHYALLSAIIEARSDFVLRARADAPGFTPQTDRELSQDDLAHGVQSDQTGFIPPSCRNSDKQPPQATLRRIVIRREGCEEIVLFTSLLELPAHQIGMIYKCRWQIELFFRWLKVYANLRHLIGESKNAITLQFYIAVIGMLLIYLTEGRKPDLYLLTALGQIVHGHSTLEKMIPWLQRRAREKELARLRREKKKA